MEHPDRIEIANKGRINVWEIPAAVKNRAMALQVVGGDERRGNSGHKDNKIYSRLHFFPFPCLSILYFVLTSPHPPPPLSTSTGSKRNGNRRTSNVSIGCFYAFGYTFRSITKPSLGVQFENLQFLTSRRAVISACLREPLARSFHPRSREESTKFVDNSLDNIDRRPKWDEVRRKKSGCLLRNSWIKHAWSATGKAWSNEMRKQIGSFDRTECELRNPSYGRNCCSIEFANVGFFNDRENENKRDHLLNFFVSFFRFFFFTEIPQYQ